jgi:glyoxylase-like metal-dependent hydrolase (beta-lactamase superfamily II)
MLIEPLTSSSTLIVGESVTVFDTGSPPYRLELLQRLREKGFHPNDVQYVVLSHLHLDHAMNCEIFPRATIVSEPDVWLVGQKRCEVFVEPIRHKDWEIVPTPGHMTVHLSLLVHGLWNAEEKRIVLAGDALREDRVRGGYYTSTKAKPGELESVRWVLTHADVVIPGHDRVLGESEITELQGFVATP